MRIFLLSLVFLLIPHSLYAATVLFASSATEIKKGEAIEVVLALDTNINEDINAFEGVLTYNASVLELVDISDARSVINLWAQYPRIPTVSEGEAQVPFAGIAPGGFGTVLVPPTDGIPKNTIFIATFVGKNSGRSMIGLKDGRALLNDGLGSQTALYVTHFTIEVNDEIAPETIEEELKVTDTTPPEDFEPILAQEPTVFDGQWVLMFHTSDRESGIDYYEVREGSGQYLPAESPYLLEDQSGQALVSVRAYDRAGNMREVHLGAPQYQSLVIFSIIVLIAGGMVWLATKRVWRKKGRR